MYMRHHLQIWIWNSKGGPLARSAFNQVFNVGEVWIPVCCHGNKTVKIILWSTWSGESCKESDILIQIIWDLFFSSLLTKIWLSVWRDHVANLHIFKNLNIWNKKRYLKIVNRTFLLIQVIVLKWLRKERCLWVLTGNYAAARSTLCDM